MIEEYREPYSLAAVIIQFVMLAVFCGVGALLAGQWQFGAGMGATLYLLLWFLLRRIIPVNHNRAIRAFGIGNYNQAVAEYKKSYEFFNKHQWLDKCRCVFIMSYSKLSYRESALFGIGYCYQKSGNKEKALEYYTRVSEIYPDLKVVKQAIESCGK